MERLNKFLARAGVTSRRQADVLIREGRVTVNGELVSEMGLQIEPLTDKIAVDGSLVLGKPAYEYLILNKPPGYLTTVTDPFHRPTVMSLLPPSTCRLFPVGRLDCDTSGLLLFTNDGEMALALTHPRHLVEKAYRVKIKGVPSRPQLEQIAGGIMLDGRMTAPAKVGLESVEKGNAILTIRIREGRKRQIRRMMLAIGHPVIWLQRVEFGPLKLGDLKQGECRKLNDAELKALLRLKQPLGAPRARRREE
ncbi:MAG: rRNA pseudouridine synthase [Firmicutes bacterium]|nr:rRNA pseudouridine synthase [Bacillota bacterium]